MSQLYTFMVRAFIGSRFWQRAVMAALALLLGVGSQSNAGEALPESGLLWNRSGLPAVFPLQVKTDPGRDYRLTLLDPDADREVLAAAIHGGEFFRVLVPPGEFVLRFHGYEKRPGANEPTRDSVTFDLPVPLKFETRGIGTKLGYIIDLRGQAAPPHMAVVTPDAICQSFQIDLDSWETPKSELLDALEDQDLETDLARRTRRPYEPYFRYHPVPPNLTRRYTIRTRECG